MVMPQGSLCHVERTPINSYTVYYLLPGQITKPTPGALISANDYNQRLAALR